MRITFTDADVVYAAGLFDGEGCVHIGVVNKKISGGTHRLQINLASTDPRPILFLQERFGGWVRNVQNKGSRKPAFYWVISGPDGENFLRLIQPHCIIKADQISLALAFRATMGKKGTKELREAMSAELQQMKRVEFDPIERG